MALWNIGDIKINIIITIKRFKLISYLGRSIISQSIIILELGEPDQISENTKGYRRDILQTGVKFEMRPGKLEDVIEYPKMHCFGTS